MAFFCKKVISLALSSCDGCRKFFVANHFSENTQCCTEKQATDIVVRQLQRQTHMQTMHTDADADADKDIDMDTNKDIDTDADIKQTLI